MPLPTWINEEFAWLHRELVRLNREIQIFGNRVGKLEDLLNKGALDQPAPPTAATEMPVATAAPSAVAPQLPAILEVEAESAKADAPSPPQGVPVIAAPSSATAGTAATPAPSSLSGMLNTAIDKSRAWRNEKLQSLIAAKQAPADKSPANQTSVATKAEPGIDWEKVIGEKWMTWVGGFTLLLAIGFAVQWAWVTFQTPPWLQVLALHAAGGGLLAGGYFLHRRKMPLLGQAVLGLGIFTLYASGYAALRLYELWGENFAFVEGAAITVLAIAVALRANSPGVILLGALGGYLTPILTSTGSGNYVGLFSYLAFLNVALVACAVWKGWSFVKPLALLATIAMFGLWIVDSKFDETSSQMVWGTEWFAVLHAAIFLIGSTIPPVFWKRTSRPADLLALTLGSFFFVGVTWLLFHNRPEQELALVSWGMMALHGSLFGLTYARVTNLDRMPRFHLALAAIFFTLAVPLQLDDAAYWGATWCVEAFIFTAVGVWFRDRQMCISALLVFVLAACRLIGFDFTSPPRPLGDLGIDLRFLLFFVSGIMAMIASGLYRLIPWSLDREELHDEALTGGAAIISVLGVTLITLSPILQLSEMAYLGPVWSVEALILTLIGLATKDRQLCGCGLVVFVLAAARLLGFDLLSSPRALAGSAVDLRSVAFFWVGILAMACGAIYRIIAWVREQSASDPLFKQLPLALIGLGAALVTFSPPLQLTNFSLLGPVWAIEALLFTIVAICIRDRLLAMIGLAVFLVAGIRLLPWDFRGPPQFIAGTGWDIRFVVMAASAVIAMLAGTLYWFIPRILRRQHAIEKEERLIGGALLAIGNVALLLSFTCQWNNRLVLTLWTLDAAVIWAAGFRLNNLPTRCYGLALGLIMVGCRAIHDGYRLDGGYELLTNSRFVALALVAALYFAAGWMYRRYSQTNQPLRDQWQRWTEGNVDESVLDPLLGVLGNVVLLTALSFEIHSWYAHARAVSSPRFWNIDMAENATYSIVWAIYAACVVASGFLMRYPLFRVLGLAAFGPILLKVFFVDLSTLRWLPRVLALAVLGLMLLGVSMLYQKFAARLLKAEQPPNDDRPSEESSSP
jgi:hypothetical protein